MKVPAAPVIFATAVALTGAAAHANETRAVQAVYDVFDDRCHQAFATPQEFLNALPRPGPVNEKVIAQTADGGITDVFTIVGPTTMQVKMIGFADRVFIECSITLSASLEIFAPAALANAFVELAGTRPGIAISGGHLPVEYTHAHVGNDGSPDSVRTGKILDPNRHEYAVSGFWPDLDAYAVVDAHDESFLMTAALLRPY